MPLLQAGLKKRVEAAEAALAEHEERTAAMEEDMRVMQLAEEQTRAQVRLRRLDPRPLCVEGAT